jgi:predicted permease
MYSFADAMLLRPLPILRPDRVVTINTASTTPFGINSGVSYPDYADLRDLNRTFDGLVATSFVKLGFSDNPLALPRMKLGLYVSGNFFHVFGVEPALGRAFRSDEDQIEGRDAVVVLGHDFWVSQYGASSSALGKRIRLNGVEFTVIGVAPEHFTGLDTFLRPTLFIPLAMSPRLAQKNLLQDRDTGWLMIKGRLKAGTGLKQAQADVQTIATNLLKQHTQTSSAERLQVRTEFELRVEQNPPATAWVIMECVLGLCVLTVSCANVAGLLLSRARARSRETAVRLAIGASRWTLIRQLLLENLLLAIAGGVLGLLIADAAGEFWRRMPIPFDMPIVFDMGVNRQVLIFTLVISVMSTFLFGLAPALRMTRLDLVATLKAADADSDGKRRFWGRNTIVAGQVALSLVLLAISAVLVQGFRAQLTQGPGFRTDHLFLTGFDTELVHYSENQTKRFYNDLLRRTRSSPAIKSAALTSIVPMMAIDTIPVIPVGYQSRAGEQPPLAFDSLISDGYFETLGIPILRGRGFLESDAENSPPVAVVNEHMAGHFWPKGDALGKTFHLRSATGDLVQIVGIARTAKYMWIAEPPSDFVYLPYRQHKHSALALVAESTGRDAAGAGPVLRDAVRSLDPDMPVFDVRTMEDFYTQRAVKLPEMLTQTVEAMGLMGLALALGGLYALVAYSVSRQTREIGIRMALGADQLQVVWMVLRRGLRLGGAGVVVGLIAAWFACRAIAAALWAGSTFDTSPLIYAAIALPLLIITVLAAWAPARRASRVDPMRALRDE